MTKQENTWMNLNAFASYLDLSASFIRRLVNEGRIRYTRSSTETSKLLFKKEWGDAYLESNQSVPGEQKEMR
jgi:excisionase family DNA binding protein